MNIKKTSRLAMLTALSIVIGIIESYIPIFANIVPGLKLGLSNVIIILVLYNYNGLTSTNNTPSSSTPCNVTGDNYAFARFDGDTHISSGSMLFSFNKRRVSPISQFDTFFGCLQIAVVSSKISAICLESVIIPISYSGISNSSL